MPASYPGILHQYAPRLVAHEFVSPNQTRPKPHSLLFVGGLTDGLGTVPYVTELSKALESTEWSLFWLVLSSSYLGWGIGSLDQDVEEISQCVSFVRKYKSASSSDGKVVVMGHSTGCQDVLHYLYSANPLPQRPTDQEVGLNLQRLVRPVMDGAIMQAPVSDREAVLHMMQTSADPDEFRRIYDQLVDLARRQPPTEILPLHLTSKVGYPGTPLNARRFLSLASPDSPVNPELDDLFSSDLTDQRLRETFGAVAERGLLRSKLMVLYSGSDEFAAGWVDKEALLQRWKLATNANGKEKWDENSAVVPGASHTVKDEGQTDLIARVLRYLSSV
ncbi:hypothetical protein EYZ11_001553 [Aspergillus tanneri]|uniref:Dolichol-phosphate mannosyltransferase n=1 Tax=Aspergillus tanneri TaxID=1220188 RepID=A0A4S3JUF2_9EURO|nr:uncharacterized protein ATNIH1004_007584 [Aspergillus tanneri]KAA8646158.1 hypothetical protein ATNIH1004_007584 [Aspergillus tanneri]THC99002.1 hypothetical protein EYZ11_001553 [Aspergillus tanneri]